MTLPDTSDIMEHILKEIRMANNCYNLEVYAYNEALHKKKNELAAVRAERIQYEKGRVTALSELKRWIMTYEKEEPDRSEKDCMWEGDE